MWKKAGIWGAATVAGAFVFRRTLGLLAGRGALSAASSASAKAQAAAGGAKKPLLVIGSANCDIYIHVHEFPKAGETIDGTQGLIGTGGKGANQAGAASRLAHADQPVAFACRLGKDDHADLFHRGFQELCPRLDTSLVQTDSSGAPTGVAYIMLNAAKQNSIIVCGGANDTWTEIVSSGRLPAALEERIRGASAVLLQREVPDAVNLLVAKCASESGVAAFLDLGGAAKDVDLRILPYLAVLSCNETELCRAAKLSGEIDLKTEEEAAKAAAGAAAAAAAAEGKSSGGGSSGGGGGLSAASRDAVVAAARALQRTCPALCVLVTLGRHGALLLEGQAPAPVLHPAFKVQVVDTTGAGDCFRGAFALALAEDRPAREALRFAAAASALCVQRQGTLKSMPARQDVEDFLANR